MEIINETNKVQNHNTETKILKKELDALQVIITVDQKTKHTWLFTKAVNTFWILAEVSCYLFAISLLCLVFMLPSGEISASNDVADNVHVKTSVKVDEIIWFFRALKVLIGILGVLMIVPARLFRQVRKKNNLLEEINDTTAAFLEKYKEGPRN